MNSTRRRAHLSHAHRPFSRRVHVAQDCGIVVCVFLKQSFHLIHVSQPTLLDPQLSPRFSTSFLTLALGFVHLSLVVVPMMSSNTATPQGGSCLWLTEQSPLTEYETKSLIEVSSKHTPMILPSRRGTRQEHLTMSRPLCMRLKSMTQLTWDG